MIGVPSGALVIFGLLAWIMLSGKITAKEMADACDRLIDSQEVEEDESRERYRTL
jgi:hypothetical protein